MYRPTWIDHLMLLLPARVTPRFDEVPPSAPLTSEILYACDGLQPTILPSETFYFQKISDGRPSLKLGAQPYPFLFQGGNPGLSCWRSISRKHYLLCLYSRAASRVAKAIPSMMYIMCTFMRWWLRS